MNKIWRRAVFSAVLAFSLILSSLFSGCSSSEEEDTVTFRLVPVASKGIWQAQAWALNTYITITFYRSADTKLIDGCGDLLYYYENLFSRTSKTSETARLNAREISTVSDETASLLSRGLYYSELTKGRYDIAIASVTSLWDFTADDPVVPDPDELKAATAYVDYTKAHLNGNTVTFDNEETGIDFGSIAKGYIADRLAEYLTENGVTSALISLGGNLLMIGSKPDGSDYSAGLQVPFGDTGTEYFGILHVSDCSVVTSGVYERYFQGDDGKWYHHILDPDTGYSIDNGLYSVSVVGPCSTDCDALSTSLFALGLDQGLDLINSIDDYYAVFYTEDGSVYLSDGLKENCSYEEHEHSYYTYETAK